MFCFRGRFSPWILIIAGFLLLVLPYCVALPIAGIFMIIAGFLLLLRK